MDETTEDILLKKTGRNRMAIEDLEKDIESFKKMIIELNRKLTSLTLLVEAAGIEDREKFLRGD